MSDAAPEVTTQDVVVEANFPHRPEAIWKALTTGALIARWLQMTPTGFEAVKGNRFTYQTTAAGPWDGIIHCEVLDAVPQQRMVYSWKGGHESNVGYGSLLDTVVTWTLHEIERGTRLRMVHSGFVLPRNERAYTNMSGGWNKVVPRVGEIAGEQD
jgi:uncharacterized protein YndB with AHSA1/START domain